jgi:hypothetical protein
MERERESNSPNLKKYPAKICPAAEPTAQRQTLAKVGPIYRKEDPKQGGKLRQVLP